MSRLPIVDRSESKSGAKKSAPKPGVKGKYSFVTLGCAKNLVDSERMLGLLQLDGYELVRDVDDADFVIVNTCGFIEQARKESYSVIKEMTDRKAAGLLKGVIVSGCLPEREKEKVLETAPGVDALVGVFGRESVTKVADRFYGTLEEQRTVFRPAPSTPLVDRNRMRITPRHMAYLKVSEGCNRRCTFCAIPKMRGRHATKPMEEVLAEARELAADGVRELNIVAQDTTYYGLDLYGKTRLAELLRELETVDGLEWIRLLYLYPMYFTDELVETIAASRKIVPYLDMPLQHADDDMLRRMQRRVGRRQTEELLGRLRDKIPGLVMRTTFIVGFPGETEAHFRSLEEFVREQKFERVGVFTYSVEPGTPAAELADQVPEEVKEERRGRLMAAQQESAFAWAESQVGQTQTVLLDAPVEGEKNVFVGRTYADAPDIDGAVYVTGKKLKPGQFVQAEVVQASEYDLVAAAVGKPW